MNVFQWLQNAMKYVIDGAARIFRPRDDDYPATGMQPFEGEPNHSKVH